MHVSRKRYHFVNDMFYVKFSASIANYADDNNFYDDEQSLDKLKDNLSSDAHSAVLWYKENYLDANPEKFQCMFMNRNGVIDANLSINDVNVESTDSIKVLGVTLDAKLNFNEHIKNLCNRASHQINALKRISRYLDIDGRLRIYQAFIKSNFTYCPVSWIFLWKAQF